MTRARAARALPLLLTLMACSSDPPPGGTKDRDAGVAVACDDSNPCPGAQVCIAGVCENPVSKDGGSTQAARLQVCTEEGCLAPYRVNLGGSRTGVQTEQTLILRSVGELPLEIQNLDILAQGTEFTVDPSGEINRTLEPNEELVIRVSHIATDGIADNEQLQIISNAEPSRTLVQLLTEYKGVPSLFVSDRPESMQGQTITLDFGNVRAGVAERRTLFIKNGDTVRDGSVLTVQEIRIDPGTSTNFATTPDVTFPALLDQFQSYCAMDTSCLEDLGDTCDTTIGVCQTTGGTLRDIITLDVEFIGGTPGLIEERILILSNDGGTAMQTRQISVRANVTFGELDVNPDPIAFPEAYVGFDNTQTVTVTNLGTAPLQLLSGMLAGAGPFTLDFGATTLPAMLGPTETLTFDVTLNPMAPGMYADTLTLTSDDSASPMLTVNITAQAFIAPELELTPNPINFGDTHIQVGAMPIGNTVVTVRNNGGSELRVPSLATTSTTPAAFTVDPTALPPIPPGGQATFNVRYGPAAPTYPAFQMGAVYVTTNDPRVQPVAAIHVEGRGVDPNLVLVPGAQIQFNQSTNNPNRPSIYWAQEVTDSVTLLNATGPVGGPLRITSLALMGDTRNAYTIVNAPTLPVEIAPSGSLQIDVRYAAPGPGLDSATLTITTNDANLPNGQGIVSLIGNVESCPARANAGGIANAAGACVYTCAPGWVDLDGNLNNVGGNGCEYQCTFQSSTDIPDDSGIDTNCDGIDGDALNAVFVAPPPLGNPGNSGTIGSPLADIQAGITLGSGLSRDVYVSTGAPYAGPLDLQAGVSIYGGYDASNGWARNLTNRPVIASTQPVGVRATNITTTTVLDGFEIIAGNAPAPSQPGPGINSIGIEIRNSNVALRIRNCRVTAGNGSLGSNGNNGGTGATGSAGSPGITGGDGSSANGWGGAGGGSACSAFGGPGGRGGYDNSNGINGTAGTTGGSGGSGGIGAELCDSSACSSSCGRKGGQNGLTGNGGGNGGVGNHGNGGNTGSVSGGGWVGGTGANGLSGSRGGAGGGGGGGGGGADECRVNLLFGCAGVDACNRDRGGGGGGGGAGGCGGTGGIGGYGGGGSFGIFLISSSSLIENSQIIGGTGGTGGRGGNYGTGGSGGAGQIGGNGPDDGGNGGRGGNGGSGGRAGSGGGGGGGAAYCVYRYLSGSTALNNLQCTTGTGGGGGVGGLLNGAGAGAQGSVGNVF